MLLYNQVKGTTLKEKTMYKETFNCKYGRTIYGTDCKKCSNNKQCFVKGVKKKNEKVCAISTA